MFFNSFERKLKKSYQSLNPALKNYIFPRGLNEYIYVGRLLVYKFNGRDFMELIKLYASVYTYFLAQKGNSYNTFNYAYRKANGLLNKDEIITLMAMVSFNIINAKTNSTNGKSLMESIDASRDLVVSYINTVNIISDNPDYFITKNINVGCQNNPILVNGITGIDAYIERIFFPNVEKINYEKTSTIYLYNEIVNVEYAIDEYTIKNAYTGETIIELWFNIYGARDCRFPPDDFSFKFM